LASARRLAAEGAEIILADRDAPALEEAGAELAAIGPAPRLVVFDQSDPDSVAALFEPIERLDVCFANAGYGRFAPLLEQDLAVWRRHLEINLTGTFLVCQAAARIMVAAGRGGSIVVNASTSALQSSALFGAYSASKAGVEMLARTLADELGSAGIRVNSVCPGTIETGLTAAMLDDGDGAMRRVYEEGTPLGEVGSGEDVADAVAFLAGDDSRYVTGATLKVDGGQTLRGLPRWFSDTGDPERGWHLLSE
jgi:NAD(P)-dependent dehydrogenase (short-subunit alcohol dehydrogenase family)